MRHISEFIREFATTKLNDFSRYAKFQSTMKKISKQNFDKTILDKLIQKLKNYSEITKKTDNLSSMYAQVREKQHFC